MLYNLRRGVRNDEQTDGPRMRLPYTGRMTRPSKSIPAVKVPAMTPLPEFRLSLRPARRLSVGTRDALLTPRASVSPFGDLEVAFDVTRPDSCVPLRRRSARDPYYLQSFGSDSSKTQHHHAMPGLFRASVIEEEAA